MSPPVYPNPLAPLDILTANYVNNMVDAIATQATDIAGLEVRIDLVQSGLVGRIMLPPKSIRISATSSSEGEVQFSGASEYYIPVGSHETRQVSDGYIAEFSGFSSDGFMYVYVVGGGAGVDPVEVSATAPTSDMIWKTGAVGTHRYVATIVRVGGTIKSARKAGGYYRMNYAVESDSYGDRSLDLTGGIPPWVLASYQPVYLCGSATRADAVAGAGRVLFGELADSGAAGNPATILYFSSTLTGTLSTGVYLDDVGSYASYAVGDTTSVSSHNTVITVAVRGFADPWNP